MKIYQIPALLTFICHLIFLCHVADASVFASYPELKDVSLATSSPGLVVRNAGDQLRCLVQCKTLADANTSDTCTAFSFCNVSGRCSLLTSPTATSGNMSSDAIAGALTTTADIGCNVFVVSSSEEAVPSPISKLFTWGYIIYISHSCIFIASKCPYYIIYL